MSPLTVLIPTFNEERNIADCLGSVRWADEILIIDSHSTDGTIDVCRRFGARILQHPYQSSAAQKNWAIPQASFEWVLVVDADERVTPELESEIVAIVESPAVEAPGYWIRRRNFFLGREIRHCGWQRDRVLRLFRRDEGRYEDKWVHAEVVLSGARELKGRLLHYSYRTLSDYLVKAERYATWGSRDLFEDGRRTSPTGILGHAAFKFFKMFALQGGIRDGVHGLILSGLGSFTVFLKYAKLWELTRADRES